MKYIILVLLVLSGLLSTGQETIRERRKAREKEKIEEINKLIEARDLRFIAQFAYPMGGSSIHLTSEYTLDIMQDSVTAWLPFFGRAYHVDYGSHDGGIKFSEKSNVAEWEKDKKDFVIRMEVKSPKDVYRLNLSVGSTGYASLDVSSNNRQSIRFSGIVVKRKTEK